MNVRNDFYHELLNKSKKVCTHIYVHIHKHFKLNKLNIIITNCTLNLEQLTFSAMIL